MIGQTNKQTPKQRLQLFKYIDIDIDIAQQKVEYSQHEKSAFNE